MLTSSHLRHAEDRTASIATDRRRRRMSGGAVALLAAALLLALPTTGWAQVDKHLVLEFVEEAPPPVTVTEEAGDLNSTVYTVRLNTRPTGDVTVAVASGDTEYATVSPPELTFTATTPSLITSTRNVWHTSLTVTVTGKNDYVDNPGDERSVIITHTPKGDGFTKSKSVQVTVYDDDDAGLDILYPEEAPTEAVPCAQYHDETTDANAPDAPQEEVQVTETGGICSYGIALTSKPTGTVTVTMTSSDPDATVVSPSSLTFEPSDWPDGTATVRTKVKMVTVTGVNDLTANPGGYRIATITNTPSGEGYGPDEERAARVRVNDAAATIPADEKKVVILPTDITVDEAGGTATFTVKLNSRPSADVIVTMNKATDSPNDPNAATVRPSTLTFTPTGPKIWSKSQTVTVTGVPDDTDNGDSRTTTIEVTARDGGYSSLLEAALPDVTVNVTDDDTNSLKFIGLPSKIIEGSSKSYSVVLAAAPDPTGADVVVDFSATGVDSGTSVTFSDPLTFERVKDSPKGWNRPQTVKVTVNHDEVDEPDDDINLVHTVTGYTIAPADQPSLTVELTVEDDDTAGLVVQPSSVKIKEGGSPTKVEISLTSDPGTGGATVSCTASSSIVTVEPSTNVEFTGGNWKRGTEITISASTDGIENAGGKRVTEITCSPPGNYTASDKTVTVEVTDADEDTGVEVSLARRSVSEEDSRVPKKYGTLSRLTVTSAEEVTVRAPSDATVKVCKGTQPPNARNQNETEDDWDNRVEGLYDTWCGTSQTLGTTDGVDSGAAVSLIAVNDDKDNQWFCNCHSP